MSEFEKCYPECEDWWIIRADGKVATTCREAWGAGSCYKKEKVKRLDGSKP